MTKTVTFSTTQAYVRGEEFAIYRIHPQTKDKLNRMGMGDREVVVTTEKQTKQVWGKAEKIDGVENLWSIVMGHASTVIFLCENEMKKLFRGSVDRLFFRWKSPQEYYHNKTGKMNIIFSDMELVPLEITNYPIIFLAGPTPRKSSVTSWRIEALKILEEEKFGGTVLIPERRDWAAQFEYESQVEWEEKGLAMAHNIAFWVPRRKPDMMALTTNVEFGRWIEKKKGRGEIIYGRPDDAENCRYLDWLYYRELKKLPLNTLRETLLQAIK